MSKYGACDRCGRKTTLSDFGDSKFIKRLKRKRISFPKWLCEKCAEEWGKIYFTELEPSFGKMKNLTMKNNLWLERFTQFLIGDKELVLFI